MVEKLLHNSRLLVIIAVIVASLSSMMLYFVSLSILVTMLADLIQNLPQTTSAGKSLAVKLLKLLDLLLIAITFQIIAVSLYRLFITPVQIEKSKFLTVLNIKTFHDLKTTIIQVSVVIMMILFLEQAVELGATLNTMYYGIAISLIMLASVYAANHMK